MFRITEDPSSRSLVQRLAKNYKNGLSCPSTWTCRCYGSIYCVSLSVSADTTEPFLLIFSQALYKAP